MNYLSVTKYIYLIAGFFMAYEAYSRWQKKEDYIVFILLSAMAFFLFYFRNKFGKKLEERKKEQNSK
jgi:hypothetical protein